MRKRTVGSKVKRTHVDPLVGFGVVRTEAAGRRTGECHGGAGGGDAERLAEGEAGEHGRWRGWGWWV